jgi:hypothetical protein
MFQVRDAVPEVFRTQLADISDESIVKARRHLDQTYDFFVSALGLSTRGKTRRPSVATRRRCWELCRHAGLGRCTRRRPQIDRQSDYVESCPRCRTSVAPASERRALSRIGPYSSRALVSISL